MASIDQTRQLEMLVQIAQLLSTLDLDAVLGQILKLTTDTVGAARGSFFLLDEEGLSLQRFIAARNLPPERKETVSQHVLQHGLAGWVKQNRQSALVEDTRTDPRWLTLPDDKERHRVRSAICVPFFVRDELRGVMTLEHPKPGNFSPEDLRLVEAAAYQAGAALRNAQLFDRVQAQQRQLEGVLNSISDVLIVVDGQWRVRLFNPEALALLGQDAAEVDNRSLAELTELTDNPLLALLAEEIAALGTSSQTFELHEDATGRDYAVNVSSLSQHDDRGYVIALHDVTSLKDLNRLKTHMIQMASHDLKNPIGVLKGFLDVIKVDAEAGILPDNMVLDSMAKTIVRMESLVTTLLDIQRAERVSPLARDSINPRELIDVVMEDMRPSAQQHQHTITLNVPDKMTPIKGDFVRLREAMNNLVENAIKYTPDGGAITIIAFTKSQRFGFQVKDTGFGIPQDRHPFIFQPYFRAQTPGTESIPGSGVGLSLVKEVVERHGGHVWFSSTEGEGSTFGFWLPLLE
jgi:PAS domain S-box-containing protein